ncbi:signal peptidase II [Pseudoclavibacter endophyticus]|uniref:Lipoprotein signal peptidase n=1 Tax=Pseudoclavibacter endophyticus TaxID=1778590 RepID=A0A6H9WSH3_9MICO|nr:signal peptidase II [Pseudoclavibacter endophyticus]
MALALLATVAVVWYAVDQFVKIVVETNMVEGQVIEVLGPVLQWHFVRNPGAAFSLAAGQTWIFTAFAVIVVIVIAVLARRIRSFAWATVFGLVLGGVLGNLTDRLFRPPGFGVGHVVDVISTPWLLPAIYNVADMGIVFGMILFVWLTLRDVRLDGTRGRTPKRQPEPGELEPGEPEPGEPKPGEPETDAPGIRA